MPFDTKINPGSNVYGDNDTRTHRTEGINVPEPNMVEKGKYQCPRCSKIFDSREDYISHALAKHHPTLVQTPTGSTVS